MVARSSNEHARHPIEDALDAERAKDPLDLEWCRLLLRRLEEEKPPRPLVADRPGGRSPQPVEDFQAAAEQLARDATSTLEDMPAVVVPKRVDLAEGCRIAPVRVALGVDVVRDIRIRRAAVSYTHLTLPTIYSV